MKPIIIQDYCSSWPILFAQEKETIHRLLRFASIEHIGSTAVPGLAAKPVIDIMVGVDTLKTADEQCIEPLENLGYCYVQEYEKTVPERRYFTKSTVEGLRTHQIHLVELHSDWWTRHLLFRDYLRTNPDIAKEYEALKKNLAVQFTDTNLYAQAKTNFIKKVESQAKKTQL